MVLLELDGNHSQGGASQSGWFQADFLEQRNEYDLGTNESSLDQTESNYNELCK
jgi:hypothetical protein